MNKILRIKSTFLVCMMIFTIPINALAQDFGAYGSSEDIPDIARVCFENIITLEGEPQDYEVLTNGNTIILKKNGKKISAKINNCGVFDFGNLVQGVIIDARGIWNKAFWYIRNDGVHIYGENGTYTGAMQYALSQKKHKKVLFLHDIMGSFDDEINMYTIEVIREQGYNTVIPENGKVFSGGADFFLGGVQRAIEGKYSYGVHSWATSEGIQGREIPKNSEEHMLFLESYAKLGIPASFYWYTLNQADADDMYYMTLSDMKKFGLVNSTYTDATK